MQKMSAALCESKYFHHLSVMFSSAPVGSLAMCTWTTRTETWASGTHQESEG